MLLPPSGVGSAAPRAGTCSFTRASNSSGVCSRRSLTLLIEASASVELGDYFKGKKKPTVSSLASLQHKVREPLAATG